MKLIRRLALAILSWMQCLQGVTSEPMVDTTTDASAQVNLGGTPELEVREPWRRRGRMIYVLTRGLMHPSAAAHTHICRLFVMSFTSQTKSCTFDLLWRWLDAD